MDHFKNCHFKGCKSIISEFFMKQKSGKNEFFHRVRTFVFLHHRNIEICPCMSRKKFPFYKLGVL